MNKCKKLTPFKWFVLENFPFIEADFDAITNWQLFCKLGKEINKVIVKTNELGNQVEELTNYFDNLDVQDEIDNKLDEMVEDGTIAEIINQEIFNGKMNSYLKLEDLINDTNVINNTVAFVGGKSSVNDGLGGIFYITNEQSDGSIVLQNNLYANLIYNYEENYYSRINIITNRYNDTDYYLATVQNSDIVKPYISQRESSLTPSEDAQKNNTTLTINASLSIEETPGVFVEGSVISNGQILRDYNIQGLSNEYVYFAIMNDNTVRSYQANITTAQDMINAGVMQACLCFGQPVVNGVLNMNFTHQLNYDNDIYLGQKTNKDIVIIAIDGRNCANRGLDYKQACQILIEQNCVNVWALDGGGSTNMTYKGTKLNMNYDNNGTEDRKISYLLNWKKEIINKNIADSFSNTGLIKNNINRQLRQLINHKQPLMYYTKIRLAENQSFEANTETPLKMHQVSPSNIDIIKVDNTDDDDNFIYFDIDNKEDIDMSNFILFISATLYVEDTNNTSHRVEVDIYENDVKEFFGRTTLQPLNDDTINISELLFTNKDAEIRIKFDPYDGATVVKGVLSIFMIPNPNKFLPLYDINYL